MAVRIILLSCVVAALACLAWQELTFVTAEFSLKMVIPAKRSDLFQNLLDNPEFYLKVHPFCTDIKNVIRSHDVGRKTIQFDVQENVALFGFYEISLSFQVTTKEVKENAIIQNTANVMGGIIQINQRWLLSDYENGTLLEHHPSFTAPQILARVSKGVALAAHADLLDNIRQHFEGLSTSQKRH